MKNTYRKMKDSGVAWIGEVPNHWQVRPVKSYYSITTGFTPPSNNENLYDENGEVWVTISDMNSDFISDSKQKISNNYAQSHINDIAPKGSLLYSFKLSVGNVAFAQKDLFTNEAIAAFHPANDINLKFLRYSSVLIEYNSSTNIYGAKLMNQKLILNAPITFPPLPEQTAIAAYLDEKCGTIDEIIAEAKASIEEYNAWKSSVIFEAVTKGLDLHAEMKDSGVEWMGDIPKHWKCVPMKYLLQERNQKNDPIVTSERLSLSIDIGVTLYAEKTTNLDRFKEDVSQYKVAHAGDLVLNSMNMIVGAVGIAPVLGCVSPAYYIFYDNSPKHTSARFCDYVFKNKRLRGCLFSLGQGIMAIDRGDGRINTCRLKVSRDDLGRIMLPYPPEDEQEKIITYLDNRFAAIDGIIAEKEALIADMEAYKKSLIFETVTGKRKVC